MNAPRCDTKLSRTTVCGQPMREQIDQIGRVRWTCQRCTWRKAGQCWQCGKPRESTDYRAVFCHRCKQKRDAAMLQARLKEPAALERRRRLEREARRRRPGNRAKNTAYKRAWSERPGIKERLAKEARARYHAKVVDPAWRAHRNEQSRQRYHARKAAKQQNADMS